VRAVNFSGLKQPCRARYGLPAQKSSRWASISIFSLNDNDSNRASAVGMVSKPDARSVFKKAAWASWGTFPREMRKAVLKDANYKPKTVNSVNQICSSRALVMTLPVCRRDPQAGFARLEEMRARYPAWLKCTRSLHFGTVQPQMDPRANPDCQALSTQWATMIQKRGRATIVYNALQGFSAPA